MKNNIDNISTRLKKRGKKDLIPILEQTSLKIDELAEKEDQLILAIDGRSGAGKSTLAKLLNDIYDSNLFHMDDFFLPLELRTEERLEEVGGNVDYIRFKREVINKLLLKEDFQYRIFDCKHMKETDTIAIKPKRINIVEGCYSLHPSLVENYDLKIFLDIDDRKQEARILKRNGPLMLEKFIKEWIPKENIYFQKMGIKEKSDLYFKY